MSDQLSPEVVDQIVFGMENQESNFVFDTMSNEVLSYDDATREPDSERYIELPRWNSAMGFQLMERFVATLRNPLFRDVLRETLASGRGVFRKFKNALKDRPDIEKLWFRFKDREMKRLVYDWFNEHRESVGLDRVAFDEVETSELVLSDFTIQEPTEFTVERLEEIVQADLAAYYEMYSEYTEPLVEWLYARSRCDKKPTPGNVLVVETPEGELAGFLWFDEDRTSDDIEVGWIMQLTVFDEFRGLGIAGTLLDTYLSRAAERGIDTLFMALEGDATDFSRALEAKGFTRANAVFTIDVGRSDH